jgi:hypothetical protein
MVMGHWPGDVVGIDKEDVNPLMNLPPYAFGMLK